MRALIALAGMAAGTYALRAGGFWALSRWPPSPAVERALRHVPGAVLASLVAPAVVGPGWPDLAAAGLVALVVARTRSLLTAVVVGTVAVVLLRALF